MSREEIHKLVGGYATGTLTAEEREALFQAALEDQELFDALAREQAFADLLSDPASKARILTALEQKRPRWYDWFGRTVLLRPTVAAVAMAGIAAVGVIWWREARIGSVSAPQPPLVAEVSPAPPSAVPAPSDRSLAPNPAAASPGAAVRRPATRHAMPAETLAPQPTAPPPFAPALPPTPSVPALSGTVTDTTGAGIPQATVTVASADRGVQTTAHTDANGKWAIDLPQPGVYQVAVEAPGFQPMRAAFDTQMAQAHEIRTPLSARVEATTVEVTPDASAATHFQPSQSADQLQTLQQALQQSAAAAAGRSGRAQSAGELYAEAAAQGQAGLNRVVSLANAPMARSEATPVLAVAYSLLPGPGKNETGTVRIQFTPAADGYIRVTSRSGKVLNSGPAERLKPFLTQALPPGEKQISVTYSREARTAAKATTSVNGNLAEPVKPMEETANGVTYVAARTAAVSITFTIDLK